jgi:hypothetical protein
MNISGFHRHFNAPFHILKTTNPELRDHLKKNPTFFAWARSKVTGLSERDSQFFQNVSGEFAQMFSQFEDLVQKLEVEVDQAREVSSLRTVATLGTFLVAPNLMLGGTFYALNTLAGLSWEVALLPTVFAGAGVGGSLGLGRAKLQGLRADLVAINAAFGATVFALAPLATAFLGTLGGLAIREGYKKNKRLAPALEGDKEHFENLEKQNVFEFFQDHPDEFRLYLQESILPRFRDHLARQGSFGDATKYATLCMTVKLLEEKFAAYKRELNTVAWEAQKLGDAAPSAQEIEKQVWRQYWRREISPLLETLDLTEKEWGFVPSLFDHPVR